MNEQTFERGARKLAEYDARRGRCYKNQEIALRDDVRRITGMSVRDFRRYMQTKEATK